MSKKLLDKAAVAQTARVIQVKVMIRLLDHVGRYIGLQNTHGWHRGGSEESERALSALKGRLYDLLSFAALEANLVCELTGNKALRAEVYREVYGWLMQENAAVMHLLEPTGISPGRWRGEVEDLLRQELQGELGVRLGIDEAPLPEDVPTLQGMVRNLTAKLQSAQEALLTERRHEHTS